MYYLVFNKSLNKLMYLIRKIRISWDRFSKKIKIMNSAQYRKNGS